MSRMHSERKDSWPSIYKGVVTCGVFSICLIYIFIYMNESKLLSQISVQLSHIFNCRQNGKKNLKC